MYVISNLALQCVGTESSSGYPISLCLVPCLELRDARLTGWGAGGGVRYAGGLLQVRWE